jgi:hypothetical protein
MFGEHAGVLPIGAHRIFQEPRVLQRPVNIDQCVDAPLAKLRPDDTDRADRHVLRRRRDENQGPRAQPPGEEHRGRCDHVQDPGQPRRRGSERLNRERGVFISPPDGMCQRRL